MGQQIIRQPDGRYAIFSSNTDTIIVYDATAPEIIDWFAEQAAQHARVVGRGQLGHVEGGRPEEAYYQFAMTWDEALENDRENGGEAWQQFVGDRDHGR